MPLDLYKKGFYWYLWPTVTGLHVLKEGLLNHRISYRIERLINMKVAQTGLQHVCRLQKEHRLSEYNSSIV